MPYGFFVVLSRPAPFPHLRGMISFKKGLGIMHTGAAFSCKVVQYDKRRKDKRGKILYYPEAQLVWGDGDSDRVKQPNEREMTDLEKKLSGANEPAVAEAMAGKDPNHAWHFTRNIRELLNGQPTPSIKKIHPPLIIEFNGQPTTA